MGNSRQMILTAVAVIFLDIFSKNVVPRLGWPVVLNPGVSFGWQPLGVVSWPLLVLLLGGAIWLWLRSGQRLPVAMGLFVGGAVANVLDRVIYGAVRDWLPIPLTGLYNNLADWAIAGAVVWFLLDELTKHHRGINKPSKS